MVDFGGVFVDGEKSIAGFQIERDDEVESLRSDFGIVGEDDKRILTVFHAQLGFFDDLVDGSFGIAVSEVAVPVVVSVTLLLDFGSEPSHNAFVIAAADGVTSATREAETLGSDAGMFLD